LLKVIDIVNFAKVIGLVETLIMAILEILNLAFLIVASLIMASLIVASLIMASLIMAFLDN